MSAGATAAGSGERRPAIRPSRVPDWLANPWGRPRFLALTTWLYIVWALVPVLFAIAFSFNDGRSRSVWQGFSTRWWWGDQTFSVFHDPTYTNALEQSLKLAVLDMAIATPLGILLAIGLSRWRGPRLAGRELPDAGAADDARSLRWRCRCCWSSPSSR